MIKPLLFPGQTKRHYMQAYYLYILDQEFPLTHIWSLKKDTHLDDDMYDHFHHVEVLAYNRWRPVFSIAPGPPNLRHGMKHNCFL